jgi:hypothetical protein
MAAKSGIFDFILKGASKNMGRGVGKVAKPAPRGVGAMPKKAAPAKPTPPGRFGPNVKVVPPSAPSKRRGPMARMDKYMDETGRPAMINATPLAKKKSPAKPMGPMPKPTSGVTSVPARKAVPAKKVAQALEARKAAYEKMTKKPVPVKKTAPVKKTQPFVSKPAAPAFKEPGGRTNRPTMGLKKYPPTKKPR